MEINEIVAKLIEEIKSLPNETETSLISLIHNVFPCGNSKNGDFYISDDVKLTTKDLFTIYRETVKKSESENVTLDFSKNDGRMVGLPYAISFIKRDNK